MGSRTTDTVNEIEQIREGLEAKITELGTRLPPMVQFTRRAMAGVGGGVALFVASKVANAARGKKKSKKKAKATVAAAAAPIVIRSGVGGPALLGAAAIWAAVRIYELKMASGARGPAAVKDLRPSA